MCISCTPMLLDSSNKKFALIYIIFKKPLLFNLACMPAMEGMQEPEEDQGCSLCTLGIRELHEILLKLRHIPDIMNCAATCKHMQHALEDEELWMVLSHRMWGHLTCPQAWLTASAASPLQPCPTYRCDYTPVELSSIP